MKRRDFIMACGLGAAAFVDSSYGTLVSVPADSILLEAENFKDKGGWVVDQQFMDQMGSSFLLAHGLGVA